ncbi:MAG: hypothetical protein EG822_10885 [Deltaproteobacteria bacterium]|nr:hypothetical protein [Deltaproteobacteria bacterium]TLN02109.1 MAG: hypothetical protein FDZ73_13090 [bacterium]
MGVFLRNSVLVMFVWLMLAGICFGKQVYLSDGSMIDCESFWRRGDKVVVKINRDTVLEFARSEIDERRTFVKAVKKPRKVKRNKIAAATVSDKAATTVRTAEAAPAPSNPSAAAPAANPEPAPVQAPPAEEQTVQTEAAQPSNAAPAPTPVPDQAAAPQGLPTAIPEVNALFAGSVVTILLVLGAVSLLIIIAMWVVYTKAGQAGWKSLVPIYNIYILLLISGVPGWWLILLLIPLVGLVFHLLAMLALAKKFGKGTLFGIGLFILPIIFYPLLAFGGARYEG